MKFHPLIIAFAAFISPASASVTMDWVTVGNPGNAADPLTGYGSVAYEYKIGKYEVTNAQYGAFLNAKGASNSNGIYNPDMASYGITQVGSSGSFSYNVTSGFENKPVVFVSWFDAARFTNWLGNGRGSSDIENGAYSLMDATTGIISINPGAKAWIPTEDEWYKAAYYNATFSSYSVYPNGRNTISSNDSNFNLGMSSNVGVYSSSPSPYGTFDQGGNVMEWNDGIIGLARGLRAGAWGGNGGSGPDGASLTSLSRDSGTPAPAGENNYIGFRVASVPEPTSLLLTMLASGMVLIRRKR